MEEKKLNRKLQRVHNFLSGYAAAEISISSSRRPDLLIADIKNRHGQVEPEALRGAISCLLERTKNGNT